MEDFIMFLFILLRPLVCLVFFCAVLCELK